MKAEQALASARASSGSATPVSPAMRTASCAASGGGQDRYGRLLAVCRAPGGTDVNAAMVRAGHALANRKYSPAYLREEAMARVARYARRRLRRPVGLAPRQAAALRGRGARSTLAECARFRPSAFYSPAHLLDRIAGSPRSQLDQLLPWNLAPEQQLERAA